jgi:filamentous hemagglutinin family protein
LFLVSFSLSRAIGGGISFDGSMGPAATLSGPNFIIPASMGTQVGGNLFHSFGQFNLLNGETANFTATGSTAPIGNIIARVTGGSASSIDGTIESSITGANLFLLNPSGVMFGANAKVDVTGAFTTGTPDYVKMADGVGRFDTSLGGHDVLTSAAVSAFGFLGSTPQPVQFGPSNITLATGSNFTVIGGAITLDGATLTAPAGNVSFFSANSSGELAFDPASPSAHFNTSTLSSFGNVTLQNSSKVAIDSAQGGGSVMIRGGALVMQNASSITSINSGNSAGGAISVTGDSFQLTSSSTIATEALSGGGGGNINLTFSGAAILNAQGTLSANTLGAGAGGQVALQAGSLSVDGVGTQISSESKSGAAGDSGIVSVKAIEAISVTNGGIITADTSSSGSAGAVSVQADSLTIDGSGATGLFTGISSSCNQGATADAMGGLVSIDVVQALSISGGGAISASTFSAGNAGDIHILAGSLTIDGRIDGSSSVASFTGIASDCEKNSLGNGGNISLNVDDDIEIMNGGTINADTAAFGHAGAITVAQAGSLDIDGAGAIGQFTGISSVSDAGATGAGGTMSLNITSAITIEGTGAIEADTFSSGAAGEISLRAGSMTIDGSIDPNGLTGISSNADPSSSNTGGDVMVNITNDLICTGGGGIDSQAFATGHGGEVSVTVGGNLSLTDGGYVDADTYAAGNGGTLAVSAQSIFIDGAGSAGMGFSTGVNSDSSAYYNADATGNGGSVNVTAYQSLNMINGGTPFRRSADNGRQF